MGNECNNCEHVSSDRNQEPCTACVDSPRHDVMVRTSQYVPKPGAPARETAAAPAPAAPAPAAPAPAAPAPAAPVDPQVPPPAGPADGDPEVTE